MRNTIRVAFVGVGCEPRLLTIEDTLDAIQALIGGSYDRRQLGSGLDVCFCDDGLGDGLPPNLLDSDNSIMLAGNVFVARLLPEDDRARLERDYCDLTDADFAAVCAWVAACKRTRFEYEIPPFRMFTSEEEMRAAGPMPLARPRSVDVFGIDVVIDGDG